MDIAHSAVQGSQRLASLWTVRALFALSSWVPMDWNVDVGRVAAVAPGANIRIRDW